MKKLFTIVLALTLAFSFTTVFAEDSITVLLDGEAIAFDVQPQIINSRTMVPMRAIFTALGAQVEWVEEHRLIVATKDTSIIAMMIDAPVMHIGDLESNEQKQVELDSPPVIVDSRTLVPVRAISDALGVNVDWDADTRTVLLYSENYVPEVNTGEVVDKNEK